MSLTHPQNISDAALGGVIWWLIGFAFAFGSKSNKFIGYANFAASGNLDYARMMFHVRSPLPTPRSST